MTPTACLWPRSWGRLRVQAWSAFLRGSWPLVTLFLPPPEAWSPRGWWGEFRSVPRTMWPWSLFPAKGQLGPSSPHSALPPRKRRLFGVRNYPPALHRSLGCGRHGACAPCPQRSSPAQLPLTCASGLCRLPPSSPPQGVPLPLLVPSQARGWGAAEQSSLRSPSRAQPLGGRREAGAATALPVAWS